jgi:hypothetical protein
MLKQKLTNINERIIFALAICLIFTSLISAQKGKISGKVIDDSLNEPLIGANVYLEGTTIGSTTDLDGKYVILNVSPGTYSISASMVGFGKTTIADVKVFIDRTTEINFRLKDQSIQMEQIVIQAEKQKIVRDRTSTSTTIDSDQIENAPIEGLRGAIDLTSSFQRNEKGDYSVRGSGSYEVQLQINGVAQVMSNTSIPGYGGSDKADNSWKFDVNPLGVQQLQLITGGFSAEYGNAQAGVVKVALKEGTPKFTGEFKVEYRPSGQYHYGKYVYDKSNFEWQNWGTLDKWFEKQEDVIQQISTYLYNRIYRDGTATAADSARAINEIIWAHDVWVRNHTPSDDNPLGVYDYTDRTYMRYLVGFGGPLGAKPDLLRFYFSGEYRKNPTRLPTPEKDQIYQNYILNLSSTPFIGHNFKFTTTFQKYRGGLFSGSSDIRWAGLNSITESGKYHINFEPVRTEQTISQSVNWVYAIDTKSFLEVTGAYQRETYELPYLYLPGFNSEADRLDSLGDGTGVVLRRGSWWNTDFFRSLEAASTNFYQDYRAENYSFKFDYSNQIISSNLLKAGLRFSYWDVLNTGVNSSFRASSYVAHFGVAEYYRAFPINFAFYVHDKMEYEGMVANFGVRVEGYNFQSNVPIDKFNIFYPGTQGPGSLGDENTESSKTQYVVLPRVGISFPIGENTAFRIQYGHFASMPIFTQALTTKTLKGWSAYGNANLEPKKTINYEFGIQQLIEEDYRIDLAIYYNDRVSQVGLQSVAALTGDLRNQSGYTISNDPLYIYQSFENNIFGSTTGIEVTFENIVSGNWSYRLSYNLSNTTLGRYGTDILYPDDSRNLPQRGSTGEFISPFDRTHSFRGIVQYFLSNEEGIEIFGFHPFQNSVFGLTYTAQSGLPYQYETEFNELQDTPFNRRYPVEASFDFNFSKDILIDDYKILVGLRIMNLFDNKWLTPMDSQNEKENKADWVENGVTIDNPVNDGKKSFLLYPYRAYRNIPRQIFFTVGFGLN